ncbi:MAG: hypothetical protein AAF800_01150 [Planctomycetota bacterium]
MPKPITRNWVILSVLAGLTAGCTPPSYVNIPPQDGDWARNNPNAGDVQEMAVVAIRYGLQRDPIGGPYVLRLPERSTDTTYAQVAAQLGGDARLPVGVAPVALDEDGDPVPPDDKPADGEASGFVPQAGGDDLPVVEVYAVRSRGGTGEVELLRPSDSGRGWVTINLEWELRFGWSAVDSRAWRVDPSAMPEPSVPPAQRPLRSQTRNGPDTE